MTVQEKVRSKARRLLGPMAAFRMDVEVPNGLEQVVGVYRTESGSSAIWVTEDGLTAEANGDQRSIKYADIRSVRAPTSKNKADKASRIVTTTLLDGRREAFEVAGGSGRFCDSFEFARFLCRAARLFRDDSHGHPSPEDRE